MATLKLKAFGPSGDHTARAAESYNLCYVLYGDCYYEGHARMLEIERRVLALVAAGATEFSLLEVDGIEIATHDDLIYRMGIAAPAEL